MLPKTILYDGNKEPAPPPVPLKAGPLTMQFEPRTGYLRYIRIGDHEIVRAIYAAVRDQNWTTVPPQLSNLKQAVEKDSFRISFDVRCQMPGIDYVWHGEVTGAADGSISYSFAGEAKSSFQRNRIGICLLHPISECAGQPCVIEHSDGKQESGVFPKSVSPWQPFYDVRKISYTIAGASAQIQFEGDEFEMEDQRNWSDASFKTYCTPQSRPKPATVQPSDKVQQRVSLKLQQPVRPVLPVVLGRPPQLSISTTPVFSLPPIGFCVERSGRAPSAREIERLRALRPSHLRVDLRLSSPDYPLLLESAAIQSEQLGAPLHVALILSNDAETELRALNDHLKRIKPRLGLWLIFHEKEESAQERWVKLARQSLQDSRVLFAAGTLAFFTEVNRNRPAPDTTAFPCFSLNPQVHAFDNGTMVENLAAQAADVDTCREFCPKPAVLSPITLKPRTEGVDLPGHLPHDVDPRQMSLFGAGWTIGSIARLSTTGNVHSLTYFETVGWRGLMGAESGSPMPDAFPSMPGAVFPMYHVFADLADFRQVYPTHSSHPLITEGLTLVDAKGRRRILAANFTGETQNVKIKSGTAQARVRYLDERNAEQAMTAPEEFRREAGEPCEAVAGKVELKLLPFAVARVDLA